MKDVKLSGALSNIRKFTALFGIVALLFAYALPVVQAEDGENVIFENTNQSTLVENPNFEAATDDIESDDENTLSEETQTTNLPEPEFIPQEASVNDDSTFNTLPPCQTNSDTIAPVSESEQSELEQDEESALEQSEDEADDESDIATEESDSTLDSEPDTTVTNENEELTTDDSTMNESSEPELESQSVVQEQQVEGAEDPEDREDRLEDEADEAQDLLDDLEDQKEDELDEEEDQADLEEDREGADEAGENENSTEEAQEEEVAETDESQNSEQSEIQPNPEDESNSNPESNDTSTTQSSSNSNELIPIETSSSNADGDQIDQLNNPAGAEFVVETSEPNALASNLSSKAEIDDDSTGCVMSRTDTAIEILNLNNTNLTNNLDSTGSSGFNIIESNDDGENAHIKTGVVNVYANVLNVVNSTSFNSEVVKLMETYNGISNDIFLDSLFSDSMDRREDLLNTACGTLSCESFTTLKLTNNNKVNIENNLDLLGHSGANKIKNVDEITSIDTGEVSALVNVLNIANTNLINSRWTVVNYNIFGDWQGDLVLPSEAFFRNFLSFDSNGNVIRPTAVTDNSDVNVEQIRRVNFNLHNTQEALVENRIDNLAHSGDNRLNAIRVPDDDGVEGEFDGGDVERGQIVTGNSESFSNVENVVDSTIFGGDWFIGSVNVLGRWSGEVLQKPSQIKANYNPMGVTFFAASTPALTRDQSGSSVEIGPVTDNSSVDGRIVTNIDIDVSNSNQARVINNIGLTSRSGENLIEAEDVEDARIDSGNSRGLANVWNFVNTNLINANLFLSSLNVFGNWTGDAVFGQKPPSNPSDNPDPPTNNPPPNNPPNPNPPPPPPSPNTSGLEVSKTNDSSGKQLKTGDVVNFTVKIKNNTSNTLTAVVLHDILKRPDGSEVYHEQVNIGDMPAGKEATLNYSLDVRADAVNGVYTNSAYAQNGTHKSNTASSSFEIGDGLVPPPPPPSTQSSGPGAGGTVQNSPNPPPPPGFVAGRDTDTSGNPAEEFIRDILTGVPTAAAQEIDASSLPVTGKFRNNELWLLFSIVGLALVYVVSSFYQRSQNQQG
jgi:uncharacterized repeat protein (TIGR01451 family)